MSELFTQNDYTLGIRCPLLLYKKQHRELGDPAVSEWRLALLNRRTAIEKFTSSVKRKTVICDDNIYMAVAKTADAISKKAEAIVNAAFVCHPLSCRADMIKRQSDGTYRLFVINASAHLRQSACHEAAYQIFVLAACGIRVSAVDFVHLNTAYTQGKKEPQFITERADGRVFSLLPGVENKLKKLLKIIRSDKEPKVGIHNGCLSPSDCECRGECFAMLPDKNVFDIGGLRKQTKFRLFSSGKVSLEDVLTDKSLPDAIRKQISDAQNNCEPQTDPEKIREFLSTLWYPLCFLDFESMQLPFPPFDGIRPFESVAFQYSLHILEEPEGELIHKSCIVEPGTDPRPIIAKSLVNDIPSGACIAAYNMQLERQTIQSLAKRFPKLKPRLSEMYQNTRDMAHPFLEKYYYDPKMNGSFSLKKVLCALYPNDSELDYKHLAGVHNGQEAACAYAMITAGAQGCDTAAVLKELDAYCALDTLALYKLHQKLTEAANSRCPV